MASEVPSSPQLEAGRSVIEAIRSVLNATEGQSNAIQNLGGVSESVKNVSPQMALYQAVALCAATIKWASHETGRSEETILQELASNYNYK
jgi:hypothetical protein